MNPRMKFLAALGCAASGALVVGLLVRSQPEEETHVDLAMAAVGKPQSQPVLERAWRGLHMRQVMTLGSTPHDALRSPVLVRVDACENPHVLDWGEKAVKKFDREGRCIRSFGLGEGKRPGEFSNPTDFDIGSDGSVWVCDAVNGCVTVFEADGRVRRTFRPQVPPYRIALADSGHVLLMSSPSGEKLFTSCDEWGNLHESFGTFIRNQDRFGIALDGRIVSLATGGFAYAGYRAGVLAVYGLCPRGLRAYMETVHHGGFPHVLMRQSDGGEYTRVDPSSPLVTRSISCVGTEIHLLAGSDGRARRSVFDVYDTRSGFYEYSYELPADALSACVTPCRIYAVLDSTITVWERQE